MSPGINPDQHANRILAAVLDASDDAIIGTDLAGVIFTWNRGAERIYGHTAAEMIGQSLGKIVAPDFDDEHRATLGRIADGERVEPHDTVHTTKNGHRIHVLMTVSPIRNADGKALGASAMVRDRRTRPDRDRVCAGREAGVLGAGIHPEPIVEARLDAHDRGHSRRDREAR